MKQFEQSDRIIKEAFEQESVMPPASVWEKVEQSLDDQAKIFWYQHPSVVWSLSALFVIGAFITFWLMNNDQEMMNPDNQLELKQNSIPKEETLANQTNTNKDLISSNEFNNADDNSALNNSNTDANTATDANSNDVLASINKNQNAASKTSSGIDDNHEASDNYNSLNHTSAGNNVAANTGRNHYSNSAKGVDFALSNTEVKAKANHKKVNSTSNHKQAKTEEAEQEFVTINSYPNSLFTIAKINAPKGNSKANIAANKSNAGEGVNKVDANANTDSNLASSSNLNTTTKAANTAISTEAESVEATAIANRAALMNLSAVNALQTMPLTNTLALKTTAKTKGQSNLNCFSFHKKHKPNFFISGYGMAGLAMRHLEAKSGESIAVQVAREQTESSWYTYGAGLELGLRFYNGLAIKTGGNFNQIREKFDYFIANSVWVTPEGEVKTGVRIIENTNQYSFIDIPLSVGYVARKGHIGYHAYVGAAYNAAFYAKGKALNTAGNPITLDGPGQTVQFDCNAGLSGHIQAGLDYYLGNRINLFVRPQFQMRFKDLSASTNPVSQKYQQMQLQVGICFFP